MHDSKLEDVQEQQEKKFNIDAIQILEDIKRECKSHDRCYKCAFYDKGNMHITLKCPFNGFPDLWILEDE